MFRLSAQFSDLSVLSSSTKVSFDLSQTSPPPKAKTDYGQYCYITKKKNEAEAAHQEQQIGMVMLLLYHWLNSPPPESRARHRRSISIATSPEQLYINSILTVLPLTYPSESTNVTRQETDTLIWRQLAEHVYAVLGESPPSLVQGSLKAIAVTILTTIHGWNAPSFVHQDNRARMGRFVDCGLLMEHLQIQRSGRTFNVVISGGGPVGLTVAMLLAHCSSTSSASARLPEVKIKILDQRWTDEGGKMRWRDQDDTRPNTRRRQVITLQDYVVALLDEGFKTSLPLNWSDIVWPKEKTELGIDTRKGAERVYVNSRQAPIRDVEDRLLAQIRDSPLLSKTIELVPQRIDRDMFDSHRQRIDLFVGADGASGKAFTVNFEEDGKLVFERDVLESHQTDRALGIPINCIPSATQAEIVFLTLCQTIYLLNSTSNGLGFLNIRLSQDLYDSLAAIPASQRTFRVLLASENHFHSRIIALIDAGFRMYGMDVSRVLDERIDIFKLALASAPHPVGWVNRRPSEGRSGGQFPMVLVGDAAMQHNFWPGRGANSGLLSAWSLCANVLRSFEIPNFSRLVDAHLAPYEGFMRSLKVREHNGRGRFIQMTDIERIYAAAFPAKSIPQDELRASRDSLIKRAILWRDRLGSRPEFLSMHPVPIRDDILIAAIDRMCGTAFNPVTQNTPMAIMDSAILRLLEGSHQWPTSDMNPLGYDLSPKGFVQPSYEEKSLSTSASPRGTNLCPPQLPDIGRRRSSSTPAPVEPQYAVDTDPAWLASALLNVKPEFKPWGNVAKSSEKAYRQALKEGYGTQFEKLYSQKWTEEPGFVMI